MGLLDLDCNDIIPDELPGFDTEESKISKGILQAKKNKVSNISNVLSNDIESASNEVLSIDSSTDESLMSKSTENQKLFFDKFSHNSGVNFDLISKLGKVSPDSIMSELKQKWEEQELADKLDLINKQISETISPMSDMEQEWRDVKKKILCLEEQLQHKENEIKSYTLKLKSLYENKKNVEIQLQEKRSNVITKDIKYNDKYGKVMENQKIVKKSKKVLKAPKLSKKVNK